MRGKAAAIFLRAAELSQRHLSISLCMHPIPTAAVGQLIHLHLLSLYIMLVSSDSHKSSLARSMNLIEFDFVVDRVKLLLQRAEIESCSAERKQHRRARPPYIRDAIGKMRPLFFGKCLIDTSVWDARRSSSFALFAACATKAFFALTAARWHNLRWLSNCIMRPVSLYLNEVTCMQVKESRIMLISHPMPRARAFRR